MLGGLSLFWVPTAEDTSRSPALATLSSPDLCLQRSPAGLGMNPQNKATATSVFPGPSMGLGKQKVSNKCLLVETCVESCMDTKGHGGPAGSGVSLTLRGKLQLCGPGTDRCTGAAGGFPPAKREADSKHAPSPAQDAGMGRGVQRDDSGPSRAALTQLAPDHARGPSTRLLASRRARHQLLVRGAGLG